jgi:hypothetical protein
MSRCSPRRGSRQAAQWRAAVGGCALVLAGAIGTAVAAVSEADFPKLKAGQWEMTTQSANAAGAPPTKTTMCTDAALQREVIALGAGMSRDMCSKTDVKRDGQRVVTTAECRIGESNIKSRAVMTVQGDSRYKTEITATYDPPFMNMRDSKTTLEGKYVGACRDGLVPGDFVSANGRKFNIKALATLKPPVPAAPAPAAPPAPPAKSK